MIDFHTHILPEIDDGARSVRRSLEMYEYQKNSGVDALVATPHFYPGNMTVESFLQRRNNAYERVLAAAEEKEISLIPTYLGAEAALAPGFSRIDGIEKLCIGNSKYILTEMPHDGWNSVWVQREIYSVSANRGLIPIIAHIDRYILTKSDFKTLDSFFDPNVCFQINADCYFSFSSRRRAKKFAKMDAIQFVGSDCHNMSDRAPALAKCVQIMKKMHGESFVDGIFENSRIVVNS